MLPQTVRSGVVSEQKSLVFDEFLSLSCCKSWPLPNDMYLDALLGLNLLLELILQLRCLLLLCSNLFRLHVCLIAPEVHLQTLQKLTLHTHVVAHHND